MANHVVVTFDLAPCYKQAPPRRTKELLCGLGRNWQLKTTLLAKKMFLLLLLSLTGLSQGLYVNRTGCGSTKGCLFKPLGCDPNLDCTTAIVFYVTGPNQLRFEMSATALIPSVQQQYVAAAFSHDEEMGEDAVSECVLSDLGQLYGFEPEIFVSFNKGKSNDRVFLNTDEHKALIRDVDAEVVDGRLTCMFTQQILPEIDNKNGQIWNLNRDYFIMAATGSAQPDEVNAHDMNKGSHFYPMVSNRRINPSEMTAVHYDLSKFGRQPEKVPDALPPVRGTSSFSLPVLLALVSLLLLV